MQGGILLAGAVIIGGLGWSFFVVTYILLRRWYALARDSRICLYYNRRANLDAPISDWLNWCRMLKGDQRSQGRVVFRGGKVSAVILKPGARPRTETKQGVRTVKD